MLKTAKKLSLNNKSIVKGQALRNITTHYVYESPTIRGQQRKDFLDTHASIQHHVGFLRLNREHRHNSLTPNYLKNIKRSLDTLNVDEVVKVIYMTGGKGEHFSNGTDFRTLLHYKLEGNNEAKIANYLEELYGLQILTSKINKPIIGVAPGHSFNSGASFLQATALPTVTLDSKLSFNEVSFGFVPHGGTSYYLSRLPGEIGTFLSLTGFPITGIDAKEFGIAENLVHYSSAYEEDLTDVLLSMDFPIPSGHALSNYGAYNPWKSQIAERNNSDTEKMIADRYERARKKHENIIHEEFMEPKDKIPSMTADTDMKYKKLLEDYNQRYKENQEPGYFEGYEGLNQNYFNYILGYVKSHSGHDYPRASTLLLKNQVAINRLFSASTFDEIQDGLRREAGEGSTFAQMCLKKMDANSELSMRLALKMVRDAKNLDFKGALQNEVNVALNKIQDKEFDLGISQVLLKPNQQGAPQPVNPGFAQQISNDLVQSYFQPNKWTSHVELGLVEKALLPTRFYYEKFSDQIRLWVNEETTAQPEVREHFEKELKESLREHGVDIRDRALTIAKAREMLHAREKNERRQQAFEERLRGFLTDDKQRNSYFGQAREYLEGLEKSSTEFYRLVNSKIHSLFEQAYLEKLNTIYTRSQEAHSLEKRRMIIKFKKFLFQSRLLTYTQGEMQRLLKINANLPDREIHMKEQWDGQKSWREMEHPEARQSFLWYLSKAVGKQTITPPELTKAYLSDPNVSKAMSVFTFDKAELQKLRDDILANPEKYELALRAPATKSTVPLGRKRYIQAKKLEEYDYWFRVLSEGHLPTDSLPYYKQLVAYRDFAEGIEQKALNTLKMTVQRLLMDFEDHDGGVSGKNTVTGYEQKQKETKHQALRRLMTTINDMPEVKDMPSTSQVVGGKSTQQYHLTQSGRSTKDIKRFINRLLEQDPEISKVIPSESSKNPLIVKFREEALSELYQLIEFVLVNNTNKRAGSALPPKHLLQERLASLTNPSNTQQKNVTNLRILDTYLNETNSEALLKDAITLSKPFFFNNLLADKLAAASRTLMDAFKAETTGNTLLEYYLFNAWYPEARHSHVAKRITHYSDARERVKLAEALFPEQSRRYTIKKWASLMAQEEPISTKDELEAVARKEYAGLGQMQAQSDKLEDEFHKAVMDERADVIKKPFDSENCESEVKNRSGLNIDAYDNDELTQIFNYTEKMEDLSAFVEIHQQDIKNSFGEVDWLHMYGASIKEHNIDMNELLRFTVTQGRKQPEEYLSELQSLFPGTSQASLSWDNLADYSLFLADLYEQGHLANTSVNANANARDNYELMKEYIVKQMEIVDGEDLLRSQSVYEKIKHQKHKIGKVGSYSQPLREEIKDFAKLQRRVLGQRVARENIEVLMRTAPRDVQDLATRVLSSQSEYLNFSELERLLLAKDYSKLRSSEGLTSIIDKDRMFQDLRKGGNKKLQNFMNNYLSTPLDVVSLAEARATLAHAPTSPTLLDERTQSQFRTLLDFVDGALSLVSHTRREAMTLGDFVNRHTYMSSGMSTTSDAKNEEYMTTVLKNKISSVMGEQIQDMGAADVIDWEYANVRTNPTIQAQEDARIKSLIAEGKGYNTEQTSDSIVESHLGGRAAELLGDAATVRYHHPVSGEVENIEKAQYDYEQVLRDARRLTQLRPEFVYTKNQYENEIMSLYAQPEFDQVKIESLIQRYTELRLKECLLNSEFSQKVKTGNNGHIYLKMLKESIADELAISAPAQASDFMFEKIFKDDRPKYDVEGRYNTAEVSNLDQVGLDKLLDANSAGSTLDKLLGHYFQQKRGSYAASNELVDQLNSQFGEKARKLKDGHKAKTNDKYQIDNDIFPAKGAPGLAYAHLLQSIDKEGNPVLEASDFTEMMELDIATAQALQGGKNGLSEQLRAMGDIPEECLQIPEYFNMFDPRKPVRKYVDDKLEAILKEVFDTRRNVEKTFTRNELLAYDRVLAGHLTKDTLLPRLKQACDIDSNTLLHLKHSADMQKEGKDNADLQLMKTFNEQPEFNKSIKNEDSLYKFLAYSAMLEKNRRADLDKTRKNHEITYGIHNFEEFYKTELQRDAKREPRPVKPEELLPRRVDNSLAGEGFKTGKEQEAEYFREYELYKENKKEQQDRNQLFFVLEQFFAQAKEKNDPMNKAQQAIVDYFKDTENTFFFDKNKIQ